MAFMDIISVLRLDTKAMRKLSKKDSATNSAITITLLASIIGGAFGSALDILTGTIALEEFGSSFLAQTGTLLFAVLLTGIISVFAVWIFAGVYHWIASLFGGKGSLAELFRVIGHGSALNLISWIPWVMYVVFIYSIIVDGVAIIAVERLSTGKSVGVILLTALILIVILGVVVAIALLLGYGPAFTDAMNVL